MWWYSDFHHTHIYIGTKAHARYYIAEAVLNFDFESSLAGIDFALGSGMTSFYPLTNRRSSPASVNSSQHTIASLTHHHHIDDVSSYTKIYLFLKTKMIPSLMECAQLPLLCFFFWLSIWWTLRIPRTPAYSPLMAVINCVLRCFPGSFSSLFIFIFLITNNIGVFIKRTHICGQWTYPSDLIVRWGVFLVGWLVESFFCWLEWSHDNTLF